MSMSTIIRIGAAVLSEISNSLAQPLTTTFSLGKATNFSITRVRIGIFDSVIYSDKGEIQGNIS